MRILEAFSGITQAWQTASTSPPSAPPVLQIAPDPGAGDDVALAALLARAGAGHGAIVDQAAGCRSVRSPFPQHATG